MMYTFAFYLAKNVNRVKIDPGYADVWVFITMLMRVKEPVYFHVFCVCMNLFLLCSILHVCWDKAANLHILWLLLLVCFVDCGILSICNQAHGIFCCDWFYFAYLILTLDFHFSNCSILYSCWHSLSKKVTIHQVTTLLATSKNVLFPSLNHLLTNVTDDPSLWLSPSLVLGR